ncbi:hypothetical protein GLYMA_12G192300v4 [Glycine max]|uniref:Uncharacterized protein n=1 Tax=Glycine max TaxID=3847 RepID=A0A0R0HHQ0_SOYBN|nr:hypothetical protein GYH30_034258 [Glycine max]KRH26763.1 hypothetical protein GLYMA_12G192300v4 [Glycine max]
MEGDGHYRRIEIEARLAKAWYSIIEASKIPNFTPTLQDPDYHKSYLEMEKVFKIFVYEEGEPPLFHNGLNKDIYATEGRFIHEMEKGRYYRTYDPDEAFVYYLPFSVVMLVEYWPTKPVSEKRRSRTRSPLDRREI